MITIACLYNKPEVFKEHLLKSYNSLSTDVKIFPIYNDNNVYSASAAYNLVLESTKSEIVVFAHQDVILTINTIVLIEKIAAENKNWAVIGAAGRNSIDKSPYAKIKKESLCGVVSDGIKVVWPGVKEPTYVDVVDECLFAVNKKLNFYFDYSFSRFHFYGADLCLQARAAKYDVIAADLDIVHADGHSHSMNDKTYFHFLKLLNEKWYTLFPNVAGTHFSWYDKLIRSHISFELEGDDIIKVLNVSCKRLNNAGLKW